MKTRLLFIPHPMPSHLIPLICLAKQLKQEDFTISFLVPDELSEYVRNNHYTVINLKVKSKGQLTDELIAISSFNPDLIIDDHNFYTGFSSKLLNKKRISIVRRGSIPFETLTPGYRHSSGVSEYFDTLSEFDFNKAGVWRPSNISDLFKGDINIIPSIPSLEPLPPQLESNSTYIYAGPLILRDEEMAGSLTFSKELSHTIHAFLSRSKYRKVVYFTKGIADPPEILRRAEACILALLKREDIAIITNINVKVSSGQDRYFSNRFIPMNLVCSQTDLMIHQCGSGTYNYQLTYKIPGIVIGSKCYDRDDIGKRLESLGAASFISADLNDQDYIDKFERTVDSLLGRSPSAIKGQKDSLNNLHSEITDVRNAFQFNQIVKKLTQVVFA